MKKSKFLRRVLAFVLVFVMVVSLLPLSFISAAINDIATGTAAGDTGVDNSTLGVEGTINWPVKIYDYLADGMLFEYSSFNGATVSGDTSSEYGGGSYAFGKPMPYAVYGSDYTSDYAYEECAWDGHPTRGTRYKRTINPAVDNSSPQYMRVTLPKLSNYVANGSSTYNWNLPLSCFWADGGSSVAKANVRYMVLVYRSSGIQTLSGDENTTGPVDILLNCNGSSENYYRKTISWTNSSGWTYRVFDLSSIYGTTWSGSISKINETFLTIHTKSTGWTLDLAQIGYFGSSAAATEYAENCLEFIKDPGVYLPGSAYWNGGNNLGFGMLLPSSGGSWATGGGTSTANNGYHTYRVGYSPYTTGTGTYSATFNNNRKDINGNAIGNNNIYFITSTYASNANFGYQSKLANDSDPNNDKDYLNGYNTNDLKLDGYNLLTYVTQGLMTIGLLEGTLNEDGTPQYRQEAVEYVAQMLYNSLVIPQKDSKGKYNYNYVAGNKSTQYGTDANGNALDLAQALRNCLGITFASGANKGTFPASTSARTYGYGSYEGTLSRANNEIGLKGAFLSVKSNIHTCMDAAYYLLNNIFVANSYNQAQSDYKYLTLSSATLDSGETAFVFDGGFSVGADPAKLESGELSQAEYLAQTKSAVEYSSVKDGGDGSISMGPVQAKDMYYYSGSATTTRFPFLPITGATGDYAGETRHYYFAEDGYRSYTEEFGTYVNRNYNYVLASNGEFVYHEEDNLFFEFEGDDDVYLFINGQLALDLGGAHSISNVRFSVNDYVTWAREVLRNPAKYTDAEVARARALDLENGEIVTFDFYYMERHGYGANMRIVTNMHITDPKLRVEKTAYQGGKQIEYGGIVDANDPIEYNFKLTNVGNTKLYNLTFDDADIGVSLTPENGLFVVGDDTDDINDDINGYRVTDAHGGRLDAEDLTAIVTGYQNVGTGGDYIQSGHTYTRVAEGAGTHIYYDGIAINFKDNEELKNFLKTLQSENTDNETVDEEQTQRGAGLWVDADVTFKGIYYTMTKDQEDAGMFDNTVYVTATTRANRDDDASEILRSEARHRVYVTAIPSYYQWADHELFISKQRVTLDAASESSNESSMLHDYKAFFDKVGTDINKFGTKFCDRLGNVVADGYYENVVIDQAADGQWGYVANYPEAGIYEFFLLMYLYGAAGLPSDLSTLKASDLNLGDYAVVRVLVIVTDVEDSEYVLDYGLSTENLDANGELFKNDELLGSLSGTQALLMGFTNTEPSYRNYLASTDYNRINFNALDLSDNNKIQTEDGYYTVNVLIPENGKEINYDKFSGMYTLTESGTTTINVDCPMAWEDLYLYYWYDDGRNNSWPGQKMNKSSHGNFQLDIPGNVPHIIVSNGTNQTVDLHLNPGQEAWVDITGTLNDSNKLYATVEYKTADGIIHAKVPEGWGDVYVYCWDVFGNGLIQWPGEKVETVDDDGFFTYTIPGDITNVIINNGDNGKQTDDLIVYAGSETWITVNSTVLGTGDNDVSYYGATASRSTETVTMHAKVPAFWEGASLYYWNSNGSATGVKWPGLAMTKGEDGQYYIENIPADVTNVIINSGQNENAKQTHNLTITPGVETWFNVKVKSGEGDTTVRTEVPSNWNQVNVYFFDGETPVGAAWPGTAATKQEDGTYTISVPEGATKYIVNNGNGKESQHITVIRGTTNDVIVKDVIVKDTTVYEVVARNETKLHIEPQNGWGEVYVHYWNESGQNSTWPGEKATENEDGTFSFTIPAGYSGFLMTNGIDGEKNRKTADIKDFYLGIENHVTIHNSTYSYNGSDVYSYRVGMPYQTDIVYGENAEKEGFTFTPTDFMDSYYSIWMAVTVFENKVDDEEEGNVTEYVATPLGNSINIGKEVQMYKKITVLPASVVYYEDDFAGIKYTPDNTTNIFTHFGDGSGSLSQGVDQNQEYGQDNAYQGSENDEITGGSLTKLEIKDNNEFASFEFTGTGFEIIGHTHAMESGTLRVIVKDENGKVVGEKLVITEFDQNGDDKGSESVVAVPLIRFSGLAYGKYTVSLNGIPVYDWSQWDGDRNHKPPVKKACICIDGVRIYQPLDNSNNIKRENIALNKTYTVDYGTYTHITNLTDGVSVTGKTFESGKWLGFNKEVNVDSNGQGVITLDLGKKYSIDDIRANVYSSNATHSIGNPIYIEVYYSDSLQSQFKYAGNLQIGSDGDVAYWAELIKSDGFTAFDARYLRVKFGPGANSYYWVMVDEIEVYGTEVIEAGKNDAYIKEENGAAFTEIRNMIADRQAFAIKYDDSDGLSVSGGTSTWIENRNGVLPSDRGVKWENNVVNSVNDYLQAGPNNEVYMVESTEEDKTALAFYVQEDDSLEVHNMQIAVRGMDYGAYIGSEDTGKINAEIQYGAVVDGELVWKHLATMVSTAEQYFTIPYTECPYDAENDRYQVVIRVGDTDITGMASYTSLKLNGLKALTLNNGEVPDVIYTDEINNTIIDSNGNTLETSKFVDFIEITDQMNSEVVLYSNNNGEPAPEGVDTSALGALYHSFTADTSTDFVLTENSKIYIVTASESVKPDAATIETAQLVQSQFRADSRPSAEPMEIVWGLEKYAAKGDIIIYANDTSLTNAESFRLVVTDRAKVYAKDDNGLLYGLNTLQKHFRYAKTNAIEGFTAENYPQTAERTVHLDVARKYLTKDWINNYIKEMSWMGYNALELHFSEDGGFRADFWDPNYFQSENGNDFSWVVGSKTQYWVNDPYKTDPDAGRYLTASDLVEICNTAKQYNIEIIPSFDTPAHVDWLTWNHYNNYSNKGITNTFNYGGTTYTLPTYINHRETATDEDSRWACLNLGNDTVQKFSFALYKDIADFFTKYAGSTKFNIGGDEVQLRSTDSWNYATFYTYVNDLTALLENEGYKVRMYNDFLGRQKYINMLSNSTLPELDPDIEIVFWTADKPYNDSYGLKSASSWYSDGRTMYNGMNYWTYYVLRIADASSVDTNNKGRDARDPNCTWWSFYRNQEDHIYNEWNPTLFSGYNASSKYTIWDDQLAGGYFMVWNDYAALNTEVEMWNGVEDRTGKTNNFYSLMDRMWSNSIKQWNWGIHNSTYNGEAMDFAKFEALRDKMGLFPGYVATTSGSYANASVLPTPEAVSDEAYRTRYTVTFKDYNGKVIETQQVKEGFGATAPADPARPSDVWYDYTFAGWDTEFTNITADTVVTATYSAKATVPGKIGYLEVKVSGGTNFTMSVNGGEAKPMGTLYTNPSMEFGKMVTVKAETTNGNRFIAWMDAKSGEILSTVTSYTFFTSGNDVLVALYDTDLPDGGTVTFRNNKTNQVIDIQYYSASDTIKFPADIYYPGYEFLGWEFTEAEIQSRLAQGKDITVNPVWRDKNVYFDITVNGGSVTEAAGAADGKYLGYKSMTVEADAATGDKKFAYWMDENGNILSYDTVYKFYPYRDATITAVFSTDENFVVEITGTMPLPEEDAPEEKTTFTVYFENNWLWTDVRIHYWNDNDSSVNTGWPGVSMNKVGSENGHELYSFEVPLNITGFLFTGIKNDNSGSLDQSPDIKGEIVDGRMYYMHWDNGNQYKYDDSKVENNTESQNNIFYLYASEDWAADNAWFAAYGWNDDESKNTWCKLENVSGNIYVGELPVEYGHLVLVRMKAGSDEFSWDNKLAQTGNLTISPTDEHNMIIITTGNNIAGGNMNTVFFVNSRDWAQVKASYTDAFGTHEAEPVFVEKDANGKDVYSLLVPSDTQKVTFTNGSDTYVYTAEGTIADRSVFGLVVKDATKDVIVNVGMDTTTMGDSNIIVFEWCTPAEAGFTFVNTGLLLVRAEDYMESTFVKGTIDKNVIHFAPAKRYQTSTGVHSVTVPQVAKGDSWIVCAFVQYRDAEGVLHTKYSKQVTGTK